MAKPDYTIQILNPDDSLEEWDSFVSESPQGSIFCYSWWLNTVGDGNFQILTVIKGGRIVAGMPLPTSYIFKHTLISMPPFAQTLGILFEKSQKNAYHAQLSEEMKLMDIILQNLPKYSYFSMNFHYNFANWLPFYWAGYRQTTKYTYVIPDISDIDAVYQNIVKQTQRHIKKASNDYGIMVIDSNDVELLLDLNRKTFSRQGIKVPFSENLVRKICKECLTRNAGKIFIARDHENNTHAAALVVYDSKSMYGIIIGGDPKLRESGAHSLLVWDTIRFASQVTNSFNFCGSMLKNVEIFMRSFGAIQTPYFNISKDNRHLPSPVTNIFYTMHNMLRRKET